MLTRTARLNGNAFSGFVTMVNKNNKKETWRWIQLHIS